MSVHTSASSQPSKLSKVSLRLDAASFAESKREIFYPAGSLSSHRDSLSESDEDHCHPAPGVGLLSPDSSSFRPTSENVIVFQVYSPCASPKEFSLPFDGDEQLKLSILDRDTSDDPNLTDQTLFIAKLQHTVAQQRREIKTLRQQLSDRETFFIHRETISTERKERSTMTLPLEELKSLPSLNQQVEQLTVSCRRQERRNQELHREIQSCTNDLMELDRAKGKLALECQKYATQTQTIEEELRKISDFVSNLIPPSDDEVFWSQPDPKHLCNYVFSKVEILASRYSRMQAAIDRLTDENVHLRDELDARPKTSQSNEQIELVKQLNTRIKLKDRFIQKLEKTLRGYKEKLVEIRDEDLRKSVEIDPIATLKPSNLTENFSNRLRGITEDAKMYHSREESPGKNSESPQGIYISPGKVMMQNSPESNTKTPKGMKAPVESDEEVIRPTFMSGSESLNNTLDVVTRKPDTPILKRKPTLSHRAQHHRTQSQNQFAPEKYQPVLHHRSTVKDNSFHSRVEGKGKIITPMRVEKSSKTGDLTPKVARGTTDPYGKSCSLDRKKTKEADTKPRLKQGARPTK